MMMILLHVLEVPVAVDVMMTLVFVCAVQLLQRACGGENMGLPLMKMTNENSV